MRVNCLLKWRENARVDYLVNYPADFAAELARDVISTGRLKYGISSANSY